MVSIVSFAHAGAAEAADGKAEKLVLWVVGVWRGNFWVIRHAEEECSCDGGRRQGFRKQSFSCFGSEEGSAHCSVYTSAVFRCYSQNGNHRPLRQMSMDVSGLGQAVQSSQMACSCEIYVKRLRDIDV